MKAFIHESSYVDDNVSIGDGTKIWYFSHISKNVTIGTDCNIGQNVFVDAGVTIGNKVKIQNNVSVYKGVHVSDGVFLGPSCVFTNVINPRSEIERKHEMKDTYLGVGATVGANATVVCGVKIGDYALIGAGALVSKDIPNHALVVGIPSRITGYVCKCGVKLNNKTETELACPACGKLYQFDKNGELGETNE